MLDIPSVGAIQTDRLLPALGDQVAARGERIELVVIGGSGLLALGLMKSAHGRRRHPRAPFRSGC